VFRLHSNPNYASDAANRETRRYIADGTVRDSCMPTADRETDRAGGVMQR